MASQVKMMKQTRIRHSQVYKDEALALADRIGVKQVAEQLGLLLNLLRDRLLESPVIHCDETRLQVLHEPGRDPTAHS